MKSFSLTLIVPILLMVIGFNANAQQNKVIKIAAGEWPPFIGQELEGYGSVGQTIQAAFASQGYQVEFDFYPWGRAYQKTQDGDYVATAVWMYAEERTEHFNYSDPVAQEQFVFFYHKDTPLEWDSMSDIQGYNLGGGVGYSYGSELDALIEANQVNMTRVAKPEQNFLKLKHKRIDLVPEEKQIGLYTLSQQPKNVQDAIGYSDKPFLTNDSFMMFSKMHPESQTLMAIFNKGLAEIKAN